MRMREVGLNAKWERDRMPDAHQCVDVKKDSDPSGIKSIPIQGLSGAFLVLAIGYVASFGVFLCEKFRFVVINRRST